MPWETLAARFAPSYDWRYPSRRQRLVALSLALGVAVLFLLALLSITAATKKPPAKPATTLVFDLPAPHAETQKTQRSTPAAREKQAKPVPVKQPKPPIPTPPIPTPNMIIFSKDELAAMDISKLPKHGSGTGSATGSKGTYGPGEGPGGAQLYPAEWYERPSHGALAAYLPEGAPSGSWAEIACKTAPHYHVENCVGLGQSRAGLSGALRQAAWQFLVLPPRVDGKPLLNVWVRIRFDFTEKGDE